MDTVSDGTVVKLHYILTEEGKVIDNSREREPFAFQVGAKQVIPGFENAIKGMKVGEKRKLTIAPELGYGARGTPGGSIPPNATLIFEVELLSINPPF